MTITHARYSDWLASVGNPEHHVVIGPDWCGCLCGYGGGPDADYLPSDGRQHAIVKHAEAVTIDPGWHWGLVRDLPGSWREAHEDLWVAGAFR